MQPFVIQCTTCKARLKVSDPSIVGDILACPKCDSMVQVIPPVGWSATAAVSAPVAAVSAAVAAADQTSSLEASTNSAAATPGEFDHVEVGSFLEPPPLATSAAGPAAAAPVVAAPVAGVLLAKVVENWWMLACGIAIGIVIGVGGLIVSSMASQPEETELASAGTAASTASPHEAPVEHTAAKSIEKPAVNSGAVTPPALNDEQPDSSTDPTTAESDGAEAATIETSVEPEAALADTAATKASEGQQGDPAAELTTSEESEATAAQSVADSNAGQGELPHASEVDKAALNPPQEEPKVEAPPLKLLSHKQAKERLSEKLPAIEFDNKVPLEQFTQFVAQLSGVPVDIDPAALAAIRKAGGAPVSVRLENSSIARVLQAAVSQHGLTCVLQDDKVVVKKK